MEKELLIFLYLLEHFTMTTKKQLKQIFYYDFSDKNAVVNVLIEIPYTIRNVR